MKKFNTCPTCGSAKSTLQPESINSLQDVFYICKGSVTYDTRNLEIFEETGICENKIDWEHIYINYGGEFDENAKIVDDRFFGWVEFQFYRSAHNSSWIIENPGKNSLDIECLDEYFENKEMYIKKLRDFKGQLPGLEFKAIEYVNKKDIVVKNYVGDIWLGELVMEEVSRFDYEGFEKIVLKVINSSDDPKRIGGYVIESNPIGGGDSNVDFYDREIIQVILRNEAI